jgi:hypothetical protein
MNDKKTLAKADLAQFTGTETWFRHSFTRHLPYTEGVKYVADTGGAYWLVDDILFAQATVAGLRDEELQVWKLRDRRAGLAPRDAAHRAAARPTSRRRDRRSALQHRSSDFAAR